VTGISIGPQPEKISEVDGKYDFVELAIGEGEIPVEELDAEEINSDLEEKDLDLVIHLPFRQPVYTGVEEFDESLLVYFDRLLEFSSELNAEKAVVHVDCRYTVEIEEHVPEIVNQLDMINELGDDHGVEICFENVNIGSIYGLDLFQLGYICREEDFSMCLDTGHGFAEVGQEELDMFLAEFEEVISHLHIQDTREGEDLHLPIGVGDIEFGELYNMLEDFDGTKCMEIFCSDPDYLEVSRERIDLS
jgi:sugar phosphate isomerase/epimerase